MMQLSYRRHTTGACQQARRRGRVAAAAAAPVAVAAPPAAAPRVPAPSLCSGRSRSSSSSSGGSSSGPRLRSPAGCAPQRCRGRQHVCRGLLGTLFGSPAKAKEHQQQQKPHLEDDLGEEQDEVVLVTSERPDGSCARIVFRNGARVDPRVLERLCAKVGWPSRPLDKVELALKNSYLVSTLHLRLSRPPAGGRQQQQQQQQPRRPGGEAEGAEEVLVGLARATSDHAFNATIWDVVVDPDFQGQGLGRALVEQMVRCLLRRDITNITLFADSGVVGFYRQMGFEADPDGIRGFFYYPKL